MSPTALAVLLAAAILHASWNLLVKQATEKYAFTWWALLAGAVLFSPILLWSEPVPARVWPYLLASALCEAAYFAALITAYRLADFSLVYPLARGSAPALMAVGAIVWLREDLRSWGVLGLSLLILGLLLVGSSARQGGGVSKGRSSAGLFAALAVAVLIALYTLIDGAAVRFVPPALYNALVFLATALFVTPLILLRYDRRALVAELRSHWPRILTVGILNVLSYALVLYAYTRAPVGYAGAVREVSIVFAALAGWRWLGEPLGRLRLAGAVMIFAGILLIAVAG
ncbi:MAG TPA: DMT family transporter [Thermoanaerobaculia bacterium]|jgi:drug/metabolite transporter (DMT)-like permease|nr:DMT family transporter [Thermoanaerobaculia bacterium]